MQISQKCSVAVHCLIFLNEYGNEANVTSGLLAKSTGCNPVVIRNTVSGLRKAGIITVKRGIGNIHLAKQPKDISLLDIYDALEPDCFQNLIGVHPSPAQMCPVGRNIHRVLEKPYKKVQEDLKASLKSISMDEIIAYYHEQGSEE